MIAVWIIGSESERSGMTMNTPRPGSPRTGYLTLSQFVQKLPVLYSKLIQTSPEGPFHL